MPSPDASRSDPWFDHTLEAYEPPRRPSDFAPDPEIDPLKTHLRDFLRELQPPQPIRKEDEEWTVDDLGRKVKRKTRLQP